MKLNAIDITRSARRSTREGALIALEHPTRHDATSSSAGQGRAVRLLSFATETIRTANLQTRYQGVDRMIRVSEVKEKHSAWWLPVILLSAVAHVGFFYGAHDLAESKPRKVYEPNRVEFRAVEPKPEPTPEPTAMEPAPEPIEEPIPTPTPKPNRSQKPAEPAATEPPKPVFGVSADSVTNGSGGVAVRVGNTLETEMEKEFTEPSKIKELPPTPPEPPKPAIKVEKKVRPVPTYELSRAPTFEKKVEPKYPDAARRDGIEGTVQLEVLIDENGRVRKVKVLQSPNRDLASAAIAALAESSFKPGISGGRPVPVKINIPYRFVLDD